jgi:hypothetical protein
MPNSVTPIIPLNTAVPSACLISDPGPTALISGNTPSVGKPALVFQLQINGHIRRSRVRQPAFANLLFVIQHRSFIDIEVGVDWIDADNVCEQRCVCLNEVPNGHLLTTDSPCNRGGNLRKG